MEEKKEFFNNTTDEHGDYIFRFKLDKHKEILDKRDPKEMLLSSIREVINAILEVCIFTHEEKEIEIDGFKFIGEDKIYSLGLESRGKKEIVKN